jgi:hypothetical protein
MSIQQNQIPNAFSYGGGSQRFPIDTHAQVGSQIVFQAIRIQPPEAPIRFTSASTFKDIIVTSGSDTVKDIGKQIGSGLANATGQKIIPISGDRVQLYLPISFQVNDALQYDNNAALGAIGGAVANVLQGNSASGTVGGALANAFSAGAASLKDFFFGGAYTGEAGRIAAAMGAGAVNFASLGMGAGVADAIQLTARVTINPNLRTKFNGVSIREFAFQFKFIPKSQRESVAIKKIIKFFRYHAYPAEIPGNGAFPIALEYPNLFKIKLKSQVGGSFRNVGTPIKYCYLRNISTVYNPTSAVLHPDGSPNEVDLNLGFTEYKTLSRQDIENEDNDNLFDAERELQLDQLNIPEIVSDDDPVPFR